MKLEVLGCAGGEGIDFRATSFLINDCLLIDAGAVANVLTLAQQSGIRHALISHAHLDHVKDLGFIVDNTYGSRETPLRVLAIPAVINALETHYFNWTIWPDFTGLPTPEQPVLELVPCELTLHLDGLRIELIEVNHPGEACGFLIEETASDCSILITGDTGITEAIWQAAAQRGNLKAIFADTAFPDDLHQLAAAAGHLTPRQLHQQLDSYGLHEHPVYCYHLKPAYHGHVVRDVRALGDARFQLLQQGQLLEF